jgi:hypothetical protein
MVLVVVVGVALMMLAAISVQVTLVHSDTRATQESVFVATQIRDSAASQALVQVRTNEVLKPMSGGGATASWVSFADGSFYYYTTYDPAFAISTIRAWGRVPADESVSTSTVAPDSLLWDGTGWMLRGVEIFVKASRYIPRSPIYFGNGGVEKPMGGFAWGAGVNPADPSTWLRLTSGASSSQADGVPFESSALDRPFDYLYNGGPPACALATPHPYNIWTSQNPIGQFNTEAWFKNSAGVGFDPTITLTPAPTSAYYDMSDSTSADYAFPIDTAVPDVQDFASDLWTRFKDVPGTTKLTSGSQDGTYGNLSTAGVTFVTGTLRVDVGDTFKGSGILVIRDDYDANVDSDNTPSTRAMLDIRGNLEWTGLVIVAGWAPSINVSGNATIVGSLFGEDSVQSGGEISLDSATIIMNIKNNFRVLYSNSLFQPGGLVHDYLPLVKKEVIGSRNL